MLVLTRRRDQAIMIGDDVQITIVDIRGDKVRLGISAPDSVAVHRREIYDQIQRENREASALRPEDLAGLPTGKVAGPSLTAHAGDPPANKPWSPAGPAKSTPPNIPQPAAPGPSMSADVFLRAAIEEAKRGLAEGGLPIGAVLVRGNEIIGRGHNRRLQSGDPMAHAEIDCLTNAGRQKTYKDTVLYSTLMPCYLCAGAAVQFGIPKIVVGESVNFHGESTAFMRGKGIEVVDVHSAECVEMMSRFIREHPDVWNEDIGR